MIILINTPSRKLYSYLASNVSATLAEGIILYYVLNNLFISKDSSVPIFFVVFSTMFFYLTISGFWSKYLDNITQKKRLNFSIIFRVISLGLIIPILLLSSKGYLGGTVLFLSILSLFKVLDGIIHDPMPFLICKNYNFDIIKYRTTLILFVRGANVITPGIALYLHYETSINVSLYLVLSLFVFGLLAPFLLKGIKIAEDKPVNDSDAATKEVETNDKHIIYYYMGSIIILNICFANTALVLTKIISSHYDGSLITPHSYFFIGLTGVSIFMIYSDWLRGYLRNNIVQKISLSTFVISLFYILTFYLNNLYFLFVAGLIYGLNLQLVSTSLPSLLSINKMFSKINYGNIANSIGTIVSILWITILLKYDVSGESILYYMGVGGVVASVLIYVSSRVMNIRLLESIQYRPV